MNMQVPGLERQVLSADEVGIIIGCSGATFRNKRRQLEALGFPPKLPGFNGWSRPAVLRWISSNGHSYEAAPEIEAAAAGEDYSLADITRRLEAAYGRNGA